MACSVTITGRALECKDALGGIRTVYLAPYTGADMYAAASNGAISDAAAAFSVFEMAVQQGSSSFTQTVTASVENGSVFYNQVLSLSFNKMSAADVQEIGDINKGRWTVIVVDKNGLYWVMGHLHGADVTGGSFVSGQAAGDLNGMTMELTAMESSAAPQLTTTSGGDITFTAGS